MLAILHDKVVVSPRIIHFTKWKTQISEFPTFMFALLLHPLIFDSWYNKESIQYLISLGVEVVIVYWSIPGPENDFRLLRFF